ncbi:hypothetical protein VA596_44840 [Amycolatopsis sp., V23-08]|uniref:Uncharacterized protein n=1 Tax=Amycolatopsis heterodermiae TaxID=3110235 RepID=A0ABU5RLN9_9PSEU|nr:hypothetical protein [Amycolatopsis sp., V23-08]MEA5366725.1 hypothetical protein [Amycolatopsis sp., V23-08]
MAFTCRALRAGAAAAGITLTMATTVTAPAEPATGGAGRVVRSERPTGLIVTKVVFKVRADGVRVAVPVGSSRVFPTVHYTLPGPGL